MVLKRLELHSLNSCWLAQLKPVDEIFRDT